ncbi:hypothetical protein [Pseudanabaena sp. FACHB-2040]|uniref:hypothetical protein n=1 Tax=Pseudanabaena sp. FACHB-2040 TaxID=2692859 RepID=UPI0016877149|nr:hypothetical protein [Pseudanabaena sp. FACHB-2040]MBD0269215.1 hypothetical protein [Cyanobacteria bacterium Co-bin8]MBD2258178.1 hypothetical protein [Pseudanabaena sp. FACHB-2040]
MFTGIDLIVIALVGLAALCASGSGSGSKEFKVDLDPLTFLAVGVVMLVFVFTAL